jgi:syntaxin 1B/2/3
MDLIQEYREVEAKSREKHRARMERQYKIVKPDATQEEIRYAMDTDQGSQVFANALTQSTRYADARNAYREVQERHADIQRIAETMTELQQIFNDLAALVERQDEQIQVGRNRLSSRRKLTPHGQTIEASAQDVETNMDAVSTTFHTRCGNGCLPTTLSQANVQIEKGTVDLLCAVGV